MHILLIEDDEDDILLIQEVLATAQQAISGLEYAQNLSSGLARLARGGIDVVLLDLMLPDSRGLDTIRQVYQQASDIPIIILTGANNESLTMKALQTGAQDYLMKDQIDSTMLLRSIRYAIERHRLIIKHKQSQEELRESNRHLSKALTDLKLAQQQIVQQERLRALGEMASGIAHDFNNALCPILGWSEVLLKQPANLEDKEKLTRFLTIINIAAKDAANIVRRFREFYREREVTENFLSVNLEDLVQQAISLTQPKWKDQALAHGINIHIKTELQKIPSIAGNESELREMLINLIFNAIDAMPKGGMLTFRTYTDEEYAVLQVRDTGTGMTEEVRQRCLEPFFTTKGEMGTGMGLAMIYGIIRRHEGMIDIQSKTDEGTVFTIRLPILKEQKTQEEEKEKRAILQPLNILVVDDEPAVREILVKYLTDNEHSVKTASNGCEGLEKFHKDWFHLVIIDRAMPDMNGDQLAIAIKQTAPKKPIIMMTGFGEIMKDSGERPAGVDFILSKPISLATLEDAIVKILGSWQ